MRFWHAAPAQRRIADMYIRKYDLHADTRWLWAAIETFSQWPTFIKVIRSMPGMLRQLINVLYIQKRRNNGII